MTLVNYQDQQYGVTRDQKKWEIHINNDVNQLVREKNRGRNGMLNPSWIHMQIKI